MRLGTVRFARLGCVGVAVLVAASVAGCGHKQLAPPAEKKVTLGAKSGIYREYGTINVCDIDERRVAGDVKSINALLQDFLGKTSAGTEGVWADEHIEVLEQGKAQLPAV